MKRVDVLLGLLCIFAIVWWNQNRGFAQVVTSVHDGDTITVQDWRDGKWEDPYTVRLESVDSPELWQKGRDGEQAKISKKRLMFHLVGQRVHLENCNQGESCGRKVCTVYLKSQNVNAWLVSKGLAKQDSRFSGGKYDKQEQLAKFFKKGVWGYNAIDPWIARSDRKTYGN